MPVQTFQTILLIVSAVLFIMVLLLILINRGLNREVNSLSRSFLKINEKLDAKVNQDSNITSTVLQAFGTLNEQNAQAQKEFREGMTGRLDEMNRRISNFSVENEQKLDSIRNMTESKLKNLTEENNKQLDKMRETVDEKLQKTLEDRISKSFSLVNERLEAVTKSLGEMQTLAAGVGDLKKVLSNVKTRGILGEVQLGAILEQILTPDQYEENVVTIPGSTDRVEFAVRLPKEDGGAVYLPIDSKFPGETYGKYRDAYETGDKALIDAAWKVLEKTIKDEAKDIKEKYVKVPHTTEFAIMFLPFEGLYAEVVSHGMVEVLQRDYKVNIAGPTTMAALLNSLQMGFRTLAIQKHSSEVWEILGAVKSEFGAFQGVLDQARNRIRQADTELEKLVGTRTNAISRKLRSVEALDTTKAKEVLELPKLDEE